MIVTDLQYALENKLIKKLDLMIERCIQEHPKKDAWLCNEGGEGEGKTNSALAEAYYIKSKTGREIHLFFRLKELIEFAKLHTDMIIIWDEPALDSLSTDAMNAMNKDLLRLAMTIRMNRHFFILNFTKFNKFSEYIIVERCLGMVHMYSRKEIQNGRFNYIKKRKLEQLWNMYRTKHFRNYKGCASFNGSFPEILEKHFDKMKISVNNIPNATYAMYNAEKIKGINAIGEKKQNKDKLILWEFKYKLSQLNYPIKNATHLCDMLGVTKNKMAEWKRLTGKIDILPKENDQISPFESDKLIDGVESDDDFENKEEESEE